MFTKSGLLLEHTESLRAAHTSLVALPPRHNELPTIALRQECQVRGQRRAGLRGS